jgi:hypothetical protein
MNGNQRVHVIQTGEWSSGCLASGVPNHCAIAINMCRRRVLEIGFGIRRCAS